jgi:polar amino acid transport system substrate-binding protein
VGRLRIDVEGSAGFRALPNRSPQAPHPRPGQLGNLLLQLLLPRWPNESRQRDINVAVNNCTIYCLQLYNPGDELARRHPAEVIYNLQKAEDMLSHQPRVSRRSFLIQSSMVLGGVVAGPTLLSACTKTSTGTGSRVDQLKSAGKITVGIAGEQPYAFLDKGKLTGEDPTVQMAVWKAVGINTVEAKQVSFDALIPGLNAGDFDVISAGMFINPTRCEQAAFSEPVYCAPNAFLVPPGNPDNITDFESVASTGIKLGVFSGAVEGSYAEKAGVEKSNIVTVPDLSAGIQQLEQGRIRAIGLTSITLAWALKQNPSVQAELTKPFVPVVDGKEVLGCGAAVFRKADTELVNAFNTELKKLKDSGELTRLIEPFGFGPETLPPADMTTAKLCAESA